MANNSGVRPDKVYFPNIEVENLEEYNIGGYHPTVIGDIFNEGRGGSESNEAKILRLLSGSCPPSTHPGHRFIPRLLDDFTFEGPNGRHLCLVQDFAACSVTVAKEWSSNNIFPVETARSIAAQLILGLSYLHFRGVCHGDLHMHNFFIYGLNIDNLSPKELYDRYAFDTAPVRRVDGAAPEPHAPPYAVWSMPIETPTDKLVDPIVKISDYGTSFVVADTPSPQLCTPTLYRPPEALFGDRIVPFAADVWSFGVNLYEVLGERPLFETFTWDQDDILADIISAIGLPPRRWWDSWANRGEFFEGDGEWRKGGISRIYTPVWRPLSRRMWDMGRGKTPESCAWDVEGGEVRALEELLRGVLAWEPDERWTVEELVASEYLVKWALPAWERQRRRQ